ncbi:hypothetical protein [Histidinibacterium lentulum]|uniref:Uncharacterized protein n=1 Tax=Histidinibacterium lentulum TaxID=2480588 RepID=A0A3N2R5X6_9RHOB|nr:hypothetical protein [Histidinibacterium lentulum]ROU02781.1 hypothetical protein EAT49_10730 [Histidinibacterium lentulum]
MISRLTGALLRALLVVLMVATPSALLPGTPVDTVEIVVLVALVGALFTLIEYNSHYPSLVEFREAPPFNRVRFLSLFACVLLLSLIARGQSYPTTLTDMFSVIGHQVGLWIDFPYSPVRLVVLMMPEHSSPALIEKVRTAAGLSYLISILSLCAFVVILRLRHWPARLGGFNVWVNLPTFDPTGRGDVVERLRRDAQINLILGFLLPFVIPALVKLSSELLNPVSLENPHTLIWTMTAWAFLPASLFMRGIAMNRVAQMISNQRRAYAEARGEDTFAPA